MNTGKLVKVDLEPELQGVNHDSELYKAYEKTRACQLFEDRKSIKQEKNEIYGFLDEHISKESMSLIKDEEFDTDHADPRTSGVVFSPRIH
jgi:hypothetical protein